VGDIDEEVAKLARLSIDTSQRTNGDKVKTVMITDPYGNHIALGAWFKPVGHPFKSYAPDRAFFLLSLHLLNTLQ